MATVTVTDGSIERLIQESQIVFLDFWAAWCGPCRAFAPTFERASELHPDIVFGKIDTEAEQALAAKFGIQAIPTLAVFREGIGVFMESGALPPVALENLVRQVREIDMASVRAEIAERKDEGDTAWELEGDDDDK